MTDEQVKYLADTIASTMASGFELLNGTLERMRKDAKENAAAQLAVLKTTPFSTPPSALQEEDPPIKKGRQECPMCRGIESQMAACAVCEGSGKISL